MVVILVLEVLALLSLVTEHPLRVLAGNPDSRQARNVTDRLETRLVGSS